MTLVSRSFVLRLLATVFVVLAGFIAAMGENSPADLIALAESAYATRYVEESMIRPSLCSRPFFPNLIRFRFNPKRTC